MHSAHQLTSIETPPERAADARGDLRRSSREAKPRKPPATAVRKTVNLDHYVSRAFLQIGPVVYVSVIVAVLAFAWIERNEGYLAADSGAGYWLGIAGASVMAFLILYPLRKRFKFLNWTGRIASWFRVHMFFGILGPTLVVLHTNFNLGSLNSRLALFTMLIVVASGVIGRYLYSKVHKGLYGAHAEMRDIYGDLAILKDSLGAQLGHDEAIEKELERYLPSQDAVGSVAAGLVSAVTARSRTSRSRRQVIGIVKSHVKKAPQFARWSRSQRRQHVKAIDGHLRIFFAAVKKAERLTFFERLFGLWHHLHVPLFVLLFLTVVIHIVAVHRY